MSRIGGGSKRRRRFVGVGTRPRRPVRWIEGNSAVGGEPLPTITGFPFTPTLDTSLWPTAGGTELINGDDDLDWMDATEATVERIVGDIDVGAFFIRTGETSVHRVWFRMGMITVQEVEDISTWVPPSLWDRESLEEYEWMWLYQSTLDELQANVQDTSPGGDALWSFTTPTIHVDLHVKRKLGKKDHIVLLGQFGLTQPLVGDLAIQATHMLRVLFKTK